MATREDLAREKQRVIERALKVATDPNTPAAVRERMMEVVDQMTAETPAASAAPAYVPMGGYTPPAPGPISPDLRPGGFYGYPGATASTVADLPVQPVSPLGTRRFETALSPFGYSAPQSPATFGLPSEEDLIAQPAAPIAPAPPPGWAYSGPTTRVRPNGREVAKIAGKEYQLNANNQLERLDGTPFQIADIRPPVVPVGPAPVPAEPLIATAPPRPEFRPATPATAAVAPTSPVLGSGRFDYGPPDFAPQRPDLRVAAINPQQQPYSTDAAIPTRIPPASPINPGAGLLESFRQYQPKPDLQVASIDPTSTPLEAQQPLNVLPGLPRTRPSPVSSSDLVFAGIDPQTQASPLMPRAAPAPAISPVPNLAEDRLTGARYTPPAPMAPALPRSRPGIALTPTDLPAYTPPSSPRWPVGGPELPQPVAALPATPTSQIAAPAMPDYPEPPMQVAALPVRPAMSMPPVQPQRMQRSLRGPLMGAGIGATLGGLSGAAVGLLGGALLGGRGRVSRPAISPELMAAALAGQVSEPGPESMQRWAEKVRMGDTRPGWGVSSLGFDPGHGGLSRGASKAGGSNRGGLWGK